MMTEVLLVLVVSVIGIAFEAFMLRFASSLAGGTEVEWPAATLTAVVGMAGDVLAKVAASLLQAGPLPPAIAGFALWVAVIGFVTRMRLGRALATALLMSFLSWLLSFMMLAVFIFAHSR